DQVERALLFGIEAVETRAGSSEEAPQWRRATAGDVPLDPLMRTQMVELPSRLGKMGVGRRKTGLLNLLLHERGERVEVSVKLVWVVKVIEKIHEAGGLA